MNFLRVILGLAIAATGVIAALVMLIALFFLFPAMDSSVERLGSPLILALIEGVIFVATFYAFRKVMGPTNPASYPHTSGVYNLMMSGGEYGSQKGRGTEPSVHE